MRVLICGGRDYTDWIAFRTEMYRIAELRFPRGHEDEYGNYMYGPLTIIQGGAKGADNLAVQWAMVEWANLEEYPADWDTHGKAAGYIRNKQMLEEGKPDLVIAFPGGKGTENMVKLAKEAGVEVIEIKNNNNRHRDG